MPSKIQNRLESQLKAKGYSKEKASAVAISALQKSGNLKKGSTQPTAKGIKRGNMTPAARAKSRASKYTGDSPSSFDYHSKSNSVTKKKVK